MNLSMQNLSGKAGGELTVSDAVFSAEYNEALIHQVITAYMAAARAGTKKQKTRAEVSGGNQKPWKQKGSGNARAGTTRGPLWRTGGRAFAARPRNFEQKVNRKSYRQAMRAILSELNRQGRLVTVENLVVDSPKTKAFISMINPLAGQVVLFITDKVEKNLALASRNLPHIAVLEAREVDPVSLVHFEKVIATKAAVEQLEARLK